MSAPSCAPGEQRSLTLEPFKGWPAHVLRQDDITLRLVPAVGGRLMGLQQGAHELCFVHPGLEGQTFDGDEARWPALCRDWDFPLWGGGKTWVAPESAWPQGAPHRDLDSRAWRVAAAWCDDASMGVDLESPVCSVSGLQVGRRLDWPRGSREWTVTHTLHNAGAQTLTCGVWDVLMLQRPATVRIPLPPAGDDGWPGLITLPGQPSLAALVRHGVLDLDGSAARLQCKLDLQFKCGFASEHGQVLVDFAGLNVRYARRSEVAGPQARVHVHADNYAHGHPLEVFNAPRLNYFEVETHSPLQTLRPGDRLRYAIHERVDALPLSPPSFTPKDTP